MDWLSRLEALRSPATTPTWPWRSASAGRCSCYGSVLLIIESRMALYAIITEMEFVAKVSRKYAGEELAGRSVGGPLTWLGKKIG